MSVSTTEAPRTMALRSFGEWERAFWLAFEHSSNGIALVDEHRRFVAVNDALLATLGATREQIVGRSVIDAIPASERQRAQREWDEFLRSGGDYSGGGPIVRPDGAEVEIEVAARLMTAGARRVAICVVTSASGSGRSLPPGRGSPQLLTERLTQREREVVMLIALGHSTPQIAEMLHISGSTVRTHVRNAMAKLCAHTRAQLVAIVLSRNDIIYPPLSSK
jgi:PAS domain S-box-containing protein